MFRTAYDLTMRSLDDLDRALLARLADDGRASVSALAAALHVARGTVQARIGRLLDDGVIRRFTVELSPELEEHAVRAITLIQLHSVMSRDVSRTLSRMPAVRTIHTTNGTWDLIAEVTTGTLQELDEVLRGIRAVKGVANTETSILLTTL